MLKRALLIGAVTVSFPALAHAIEPAAHAPSPTQSDPVTTDPAPEPGKKQDTGKAQPAPESAPTSTDGPDSGEKQKPAPEPDSASN
mgnify:CR=1 FL=1